MYYIIRFNFSVQIPWLRVLNISLKVLAVPCQQVFWSLVKSSLILIFFSHPSKHLCTFPNAQVITSITFSLLVTSTIRVFLFVSLLLCVDVIYAREEGPTSLYKMPMGAGKNQHYYHPKNKRFLKHSWSNALSNKGIMSLCVENIPSPIVFLVLIHFFLSFTLWLGNGVS